MSKAAQIQGVSPDTFKRRYRHPIRRLSPRRNGVKLRDLLDQRRVSTSKRKSGAGHETGAAP